MSTQLSLHGVTESYDHRLVLDQIRPGWTQLVAQSTTDCCRSRSKFRPGLAC